MYPNLSEFAAILDLFTSYKYYEVAYNRGDPPGDVGEVAVT